MILEQRRLEQGKVRAGGARDAGEAGGEIDKNGSDVR